MAISDAEYQAWLESNAAIRCVLVEATANIGNVEQVNYLSSQNYYDEVNGRSYLAIVSGGVSFTEDMGVGGNSAAMSWGEIEMHNVNGEFDFAFDWVWANRPVKVYIGDVSWPKADFRVILDGTVQDIGSSAQNKITIKVRDKLQLLNCPISEAKLGGTSANKDALLPVLFGECFNITPLLTNPATLEYQLSIGNIEDIIEERDGDVPLNNGAKLLNTGKFTLVNPPIGAVTVSAQGYKFNGVYSNTIAGTIQNIVTQFGKAATRFTLADIDQVNFAAFEAANSQAIGVYVNSRENVIQVCQDLAASVDAKLVPSRSGQLRLFQIKAPSGTPIRTITAADMAFKSLQIVARIPVQSTRVLNYCKNWTVQTDLKTAIPAEHKALFAKEFLKVQSTDAAVQAMQRDTTAPEPINTYLINTDEAQAECDRQLNFYKVQHALYQFDGLPSCLSMQLGDIYTLQHQRFNLSAGKLCMVVKLRFDWFKFRVQVTVLI